MKQQIPEVRIKYAWLLSNAASVVLNEKWGDGTPLRSFEEFEAVANTYHEWWSPYNDIVMHGICDIFNLEFRQNIIDVNVAPWFSPISDPMVIPPIYKNADELVNNLAHEMLHRLLTDNTAQDYEHDHLKDWEQLFGDQHALNTLIHIPIHAGMKMLYLNIMQRPDLLELDLKESQNYPDYAKAWDYVQENDYRAIISKLKHNA